MISDKEIFILLQEFYNTYNKLDKLTEEILKREKDLKDISDALCLGSTKLSDTPKGNDIHSPVERIEEEIQKITTIYENRLIGIRKELEETTKKQSILSKWIDSGKLNEVETKVIEYIIKERMPVRRVANKLSYSVRAIKYKRKKAYEKLRKVCTILH